MISKTLQKCVRNRSGSSKNAEKLLPIPPISFHFWQRIGTYQRVVADSLEKIFFPGPPPDQPPHSPLRSIKKRTAAAGGGTALTEPGNPAVSPWMATEEQIWNTTSSLSRDCFSSRDMGTGFRRNPKEIAGAEARRTRPETCLSGLTRQSRLGPSSSRRHSPSKDGRLSTPYAPPPRFSGPSGDDAVPDTASSRHRLRCRDPAPCAGFARRVPRLTNGLSRAEGSSLAEGDPRSGPGLNADQRSTQRSHLTEFVQGIEVMWALSSPACYFP